VFVVASEAVDNCPHPAVPFAAKYSNVTGGPNQVRNETLFEMFY